ncbi:MAG TPA: DUF2079 domain-containing protein, partial [Methanospirillum sp.]|nr:DUF2079 domain-containing protein [Methanospirillum sp.]
ILFFAIYFLLRKQIHFFIILSVLALTIKEDVSLLLIMLTIYAIYNRMYITRSQKNVLYLLVGLYSAWLIISLTYIIPLFNYQGYIFSSRYVMDDGIASLVTHNYPLKIIYLLLLFIPLGFTPMAAPEFLFIFFPSFAEILFQSNVAYRITTQYSALLIPIIFTSAIMGTQKIIQFITENRPSVKRYILPGLVIFGLLSCALCTPAPISPYTLYYKFSPNSCQYIIDEHTGFLQEAISMIPENASISTQNNLASHLSKRKDVFLEYKPEVEYIFIDKKTSNVEWLGNSEIIFPIEKYSTLYDMDGIFLFKIRNQ